MSSYSKNLTAHFGDAMSRIEESITKIRKEIDSASAAAGRVPSSITLMGVTKTRSREEVEEALRCGITVFGENRVQEAAAKFEDELWPGEFHIIGHLQSNKVKKAVTLASWIDSVDSEKLLEKINKHAEILQKKVEILFEYNISGEKTKSGFRDPNCLFKAILSASKMEWVDVRGLMTLGPLTDDDEAVRSAFRRMQSLFLQVQEEFSELPVDTLSMGMSGDWKRAVEEGSTMIRLGTALFGSR